MQRSRQKYILMITALCAAVAVLYGAAWAEEGSRKLKKKYPHPHSLHLEVVSQKAADISVDEVKDWPGFLRALQGKQQVLSLSAEARILVSGLKPDAVNEDDKTAVLNELNKLLADEVFSLRARSIAGFSDETRKAEMNYLKTKSADDIKWFNRNVISDIFPQILRKAKGAELKKITCSTCHEGYAKAEKAVKEAGINEGIVMECFSKAITGDQAIDECVEKASMLKKAKIEPYGPLKNFIQRKGSEEEIPFFVAVHPENPYTFKPLINKLLCLECHGQDRKVTKIKGKDGKMKDIPIFYGLGAKKRHEHKDE